MKVLASPSSIGQIDLKPFELLESYGYEVVKNPYGRKLTEKETIALAKDCVGIVAGVESLNSTVIDALPQLKCISRVGVGMDSVDIPYAESKGIKVLNTPDGPTRAVAEFTLGLTLSLLRKIPNAHLDLKNKIWKKQTGSLLLGKKVGVLGLGRIGKMVAESFRALGNPVCGFDPFPNIEWAKQKDVEIIGFDELLSTCDILTIHVPGNKDGSSILGKDQLALLKRECFVINVSRGGVIDEDALYDALKAEKIAAVALDVFSNEPYDGKLCELENVTLTPHIGSYAKEGKLKMEVDAAQNLINALN
jgi:D-3-phosphoglycerate dehydrogenase / 2-oxoglutarate reductase